MGDIMIKVKLNELLKNRGKTKYWLAKQTQISPNSIGRIVNEETTSISYEILDKICIALQCEVGDVLECVKNISINDNNK
jgi:putative transcriptional regulator